MHFIDKSEQWATNVKIRVQMYPFILRFIVEMFWEDLF